MRSYFIFKNEDSRDWGVLLSAPAPLIRARERITDLTVPGRPGTLTLTEGDKIYEPYTQTLTLSVPEAAINRGAMEWLSGAGYVTFSTDPDRRQRARVVNNFTLNRVSAHLNWYRGTVSFYCQPYKELLSEESAVIASAGTTLANTGAVKEKPVIYISGYGDVTISVNGAEFKLAGITQAQNGAVIDCENSEVTTPDGTQLLTSISSGEFPALDRGLNTVTWSGANVSGVTFKRRQRFI